MDHPSYDAVAGWSPDGQRLLFTSNRCGTTSLWAVTVKDGRPQGLPELLERDFGTMQPLVVTGSGAVFSARRNFARQEIQSATFDTRDGFLRTPPLPAASRFTGSSRFPDWSPKGEYLAYVTPRGVGLRSGTVNTVVIQSVDTGQVRQVTPSPNLVPIWSLRWAPNGQSLYLSGQDTRGRRGIFQVDADRGEALLVVETVAFETAFSPDGRTLYYDANSDEGSVIIEHDLASGAEIPLFKTAGGRRLGGAPMISPDGEYIAAAVLRHRPLQDRRVACASCHDPERGFSDGRPVAVGVFNLVCRRSAPVIATRCYGQSFFWDGRAATLEEQVLQPIQDPDEMGRTSPRRVHASSCRPTGSRVRSPVTSDRFSPATHASTGT